MIVATAKSGRRNAVEWQKQGAAVATLLDRTRPRYELRKCVGGSAGLLESQLGDLGLYADANLKALSWLNFRGGVRTDLFTFNVLDNCAVHDAKPARASPPVDQSCLSIQDNGDVSMIVLPEGRIEVHSSDVKKARLEFQLNRKPPEALIGRPLDEASPEDIKAFLTRWRHSRFDLQRQGCVLMYPCQESGALVRRHRRGKRYGGIGECVQNAHQ